MMESHMTTKEQALSIYYRLLAEKTLTALSARGIEGCYVEKRAEAMTRLVELIPEGASVSCGGSATLRELEVFKTLAVGNYRLMDPASAKSGAEADAIAHEGMNADVYLMSTDAIAATGELVNLDGIGNRVSALSYGPRKVIVVASANKISPDLPSAIQRVKTHAAPLAVLTYRTDFGSYETLSVAAEHAGNQLLITTGSVIPKRIQIIIVGEPLGC